VIRGALGLAAIAVGGACQPPPGRLAPGAGIAAPDAGAAPDAAPDAAARLALSEVGLYADIATRTLAPGVVEYAPAYALWSDGAIKRRWIALPAGAVIDTSDMDHWQFPIGTKLFKEFRVGDVVVETRVIERTGPDDYFMGAFVWNDDDSDAVFAPDGQRDARATQHDVPRDVACWDCHEGEAGRVLGFSAAQLSHDGPGLTLSGLADAGALSSPPPAGVTYPIPGNDIERSALGYLHANCGHCHHESGPGFEDVDLVLRVDVDETEPSATRLFATTVGVGLERWETPAYDLRIAPGQPEASAVVARMNLRGGAFDQMPPLATEIVDTAAVDRISAWIASITVADPPAAASAEARPALGH
jgi:hypothetical protein